MARHLHIRKSGRFPTFSGWELRRSALRLAITCVSNTPMDHASPFHTFTFQKLFNDIRNFSIQWVLTFVIAFWRFESPSGLNSQSGSSLWSVEVHSFGLSHTPRSMKCDSWASLLVRSFVSPCFGHEPKVKATTHSYSDVPNYLTFCIWYICKPCINFSFCFITIAFSQ